jgi:type VI secretion system protein ImpA
MPLRADILAPVSEQKPCGVSIVNDPSYLKLRDLRQPNDAAFRAWLEPRNPGGPPKLLTKDIWMPKEPAKFLNQASDAFVNKSKELELAVWLVEALIWLEGFAGLHEGLKFIFAFLQTYWDTLHPQPDPEYPGDFGMRFRHIEWLGNYFEMTKGSSPILALGFAPLTKEGMNYIQYKESREMAREADASGRNREAREEAIAEGKVSPEVFDASFTATPKPFYKSALASLQGSIEVTLQLEELCNAKFTDDQPSFTKLKSTLEQMENAVRILLTEKLKTDPDPVEMSLSPEGGPAADGSAPGGGRGTWVSTGPSMIDQMLEEAGDLPGLEPANPKEAILRIVAATRYLRRQDASHPASYLILRGLRWGELRSNGGEVPPGLLAAPPTEVRARIRNLAIGRQWHDVIETAEGAMASECGRGWLDLQRYTVRACEELGYANAAKAIRAQLARLLQDYPDLTTKTLLDDTGTVNPDTAKWLAENMGEPLPEEQPAEEG